MRQAYDYWQDQPDRARSTRTSPASGAKGSRPLAPSSVRRPDGRGNLGLFGLEARRAPPPRERTKHTSASDASALRLSSRSRARLSRLTTARRVRRARRLSALAASSDEASASRRVSPFVKTARRVARRSSSMVPGRAPRSPGSTRSSLMFTTFRAITSTPSERLSKERTPLATRQSYRSSDGLDCPDPSLASRALADGFGARRTRCYSDASSGQSLVSQGNVRGELGRRGALPYRSSSGGWYPLAYSRTHPRKWNRTTREGGSARVLVVRGGSPPEKTDETSSLRLAERDGVY